MSDNVRPSGVETAVASRYKGEERPHPSRWTIQPKELTYSPRVTKAEIKRRGLDDTRERLRLQREETRQQRIRIRRDVPDSPIILEATGYDVNATIYHVEPATAGLHISVEDFEQLSKSTGPDEISSGAKTLDESSFHGRAIL